VLLLQPILIKAESEQNNRFIEQAQINLKDKASLQRGAKWFMNYCSGCHSLKYLRYNRLALDLGIIDEIGKINAKLVKANLIFTNAKITDAINTSMSEKDAKQWFGDAPPDLSLTARSRGSNWLYSYLISFYSDPKRPWGTNNLLYPDVAMPNVLINLQGEQIPIYHDEIQNIDGKKQIVKVIDHVATTKPGLMSPVQFNAMVNDLVNFLTYVSEPEQTKRIQLGIWVLLFLVIFAIITFLLKREYWKDVK
jgi:ubiquinol-cytochrome c reductase cytochrome c1 subunit